MRCSPYQKVFQFSLQILLIGSCFKQEILILHNLHHFKPKADTETKDIMTDLSFMILSFAFILHLEWRATYGSHWNKHVPKFQVQNVDDILFERIQWDILHARDLLIFWKACGDEKINNRNARKDLSANQVKVVWLHTIDR